MELSSVVVDILKLGLTGLVFLLMYLGFRLLAQEQKKKTPSKELLKRASLFVWQSIAIACLVGAVEVGHRVVDQNTQVPKNLESCLAEIEALNMVSQHGEQTLDSLRAAIRNTWTMCVTPV